MTTIYSMARLRGIQIHGVPPRGPQLSRLSAHYLSADSEGSERGEEDDDSDEDFPCSDEDVGSVRSVQSPADGLYGMSQRSGDVSLSQEYADYLQGGILPQDLITQVQLASGSEAASGSRHSSAFDLPDLGLADSDLSEPPDFLGEAEESDDSGGESESDGELSNVNTMDLEDDGSPDDFFDDVPNPPQLPSVSEERIQEAWTLGEASFAIFLCPITHDVMTDPVVASDGYTYERAAIARWFESSRKSPVTGQSLPYTDLVPNHSVRTLLKTLIDMTESSRDEEVQKTPKAAKESKENSEEHLPSSTGEELHTTKSAQQQLDLIRQSRPEDSSSADGALAENDRKKLPSPPLAPPFESQEKLPDRRAPQLSARLEALSTGSAGSSSGASSSHVFSRPPTASSTPRWLSSASNVSTQLGREEGPESQDLSLQEQLQRAALLRAGSGPANSRPSSSTPVDEGGRKRTSSLQS